MEPVGTAHMLRSFAPCKHFHAKPFRRILLNLWPSISNEIGNLLLRFLLLS